MVTWQEFCDAAPELAQAVRARFDAHLHHVLATLRRDGSPRLSGTEVRFHDGQVWLGSMPGSRKAVDLRRDGRFALHSAPVDLELLRGDARLEGVAAPVTDDATVTSFLRAAGSSLPPAQVDLFRLELAAAVLTTVRAERLVVDSWTPEGGLRSVSRT